MQWKTPKNTDKYQWTDHVQMKMHFYGISEQKVLGVIRNPKRIETGIVEDTIAVMQPVGSISRGSAKPKWGQPKFPEKEISIDDNKKENWSSEIWVMYKIKAEGGKSKVESKIQNIKLKKLQEKLDSKKKITIISAWRYPGMAPDRDPIPNEIMRELEEIL
jgi:hypothetical protein